MDLHVVEVRYRSEGLNRGPLHEADTYREQGTFETDHGSVSYGAPELADSTYSDDPVTTLGVIGGQIADSISQAIHSGRRVVMVGGNCSSLPAMIGGLQQGFGETKKIGLVWFDAHGDFNTPRTSYSGMLGGMPVAVSAGLCFPDWRMRSHQPVPLPTDRIVMVDVRNLDEDEGKLINATDVTIVPVDGPDLKAAVKKLAQETDLIYLHIDLDILDESLVPTHRTKEPNGPDVATTLQAMKTVIDTGKVAAIGMVSVYPNGEGGEIGLNASAELLRESVAHWQERGTV